MDRPISRDERQYRRFLEETPAGPGKWYEAGHRFNAAGYHDHPATQVTWLGACAFAAWRNARLPSATEWQAAARGPEGRIYPWGNEFDPSRCNVDSEGTTPVDYYGAAGASYHGCRDMVGNVFEWTSSDAPGKGRVFTWVDGSKHFGLSFKLLCGGCWAMFADVARADSCRVDFTPVQGSGCVGFRCARQLERAPSSQPQHPQAE